MTGPTGENDRRLLLVHAHPDDETTSTGATMARYAADGAAVTLITCTLGEMGEVLVPELAELAADRADQLGGYRIGELAKAMVELGVTDHRFLGGPGRFRDSDMMGEPGNRAPRAFWRADTDPEVMAAAVAAAVAVIREIRPQVLITYDENGAYGHPDHIMAHRVAMAAVDAAAAPGGDGEPWSVTKVYWTAIPYSVLQRGMDAAKAAGVPFFDDSTDRAEDLPIGCPDDQVDSVIDGRDFLTAKTAAMRAHASQVAADSVFFAVMGADPEGMWGMEYYRLVRGEAAGERDADGRETDLFAGVGD